jgi:hypothetical protein
MKFRKKPVVVEAVQWFSGVQHLGVFIEQAIGQPFVITMHGQRAYLAEGDWIIAEPVPDRYYPCKPDVFNATYEKVL